MRLTTYLREWREPLIVRGMHSDVARSRLGESFDRCYHGVLVLDEAASSAHRKQLATWSLTMPTACMNA
jgi:hypothetical protein